MNCKHNVLNRCAVGEVEFYICHECSKKFSAKLKDFAITVAPAEDAKEKV